MKIKNNIIKYFFISFVFVAVISLITYNPSDPSLFYYNSDTNITSINNFCGLFGSHLAAILVYVFGVASFIFIFLLIYLAVILIKNSFKKEWERLFSVLLLIASISVLCNIYKISIMNGRFVGGGITGIFLLSGFMKLFDQSLILSVLYSLIWISLILITRASFASFIYKNITYKYYSLTFHEVVFNSYQLIKNIISIPFLSLTKLFKQDKNQDEMEELFELEYGHILNESIIDDEFWRDYLDGAPEVICNSDTPIINTGKDAIKEVNIKEIGIKEESYSLPNLNIFTAIEETHDNKFKKELEQNARILEEKLKCFGVFGSVVLIEYGPVITLFEYQPHIDSKISKIIALEDDLAMALEATSIRIIAPIPGKSVVGFEIANKCRKDVSISNVIKSSSYVNFSGYLPLILGEDTIGNKIVVDLVKMPHLLIAGSTGSGKSVALSTMIISLLCKRSPQELKLILIDPKRLEFAPYADISHLLFPIVTVPKYSITVLRWLVQEMENRYETMAQAGVKNIFEYNKYCEKNYLSKLPFIVIIIDELADLMMVAGKEVEDLITRISQMARASGIHMIIATQRPSVDVITGLIKVNFPSRISFKVTSKFDSRTILDCTGADKLLGKGDMLFLDSQTATLRRIHGAYVSDNDINKVVSHIRAQGPVKYLNLSEAFMSSKQDLDLQNSDDAIYKDIILFLKEVDEVSISLLQRKFRIGYNRSARIIEKLESQGYIITLEGGKTRKVVREQ